MGQEVSTELAEVQQNVWRRWRAGCSPAPPATAPGSWSSIRAASPAALPSSWTAEHPLAIAGPVKACQIDAG